MLAGPTINWYEMYFTLPWKSKVIDSSVLLYQVVASPSHRILCMFFVDWVYPYPCGWLLHIGIRTLTHSLSTIPPHSLLYTASATTPFDCCLLYCNPPQEAHYPLECDRFTVTTIKLLHPTSKPTLPQANPRYHYCFNTISWYCILPCSPPTPAINLPTPYIMQHPAIISHTPTPVIAIIWCMYPLHHRR